LGFLLSFFHSSVFHSANADTPPFKSLGFFLCFWKSLLCSPRLHLFDQKYSKKQQCCEILFHL